MYSLVYENHCVYDLVPYKLVGDLISVHLFSDSVRVQTQKLKRVLIPARVGDERRNTTVNMVNDPSLRGLAFDNSTPFEASQSREPKNLQPSRPKQRRLTLFEVVQQSGSSERRRSSEAHEDLLQLHATPSQRGSQIPFNARERASGSDVVKLSLTIIHLKIAMSFFF